jgi:pimeloyl-ACP methyl ester carboxylesterase
MTITIPKLEGDYVEVERTRTYYSDYRAEGVPPSTPHTIVGLNGLAGSCDSFWPLLVELPAGWRWLLPDLPGGGKSGRLPVRHDLPGYVAWLDALLDQFAIDGPVVLQSIATGAAIALEYALLFPQRVRAMILHLPVFDGAAFNPALRRIVSTVATSKLGQNALDALRHNQEFMLKIIAHEPPEAIPEMAMRDIEHKQQADLPAVGEFLAAVMQNDALPKLAKVDVPLLILASAHDFSAPLPFVQQIIAQHPSNRHLYVNEGGHAWNEEFIAAMNKQSSEFLAALPTG